MDTDELRKQKKSSSLKTFQVLFSEITQMCEIGVSQGGKGANVAVSTKRRCLSINPHGVTTQKTNTDIIQAGLSVHTGNSLIYPVSTDVPAAA
jgi:hypothetical protein